MSLINLQDGILKSPLVQTFQTRADDMARAVQATHVSFNEELARQADEVVLQTRQTEQETIREDMKREQQERQRRIRRRVAAATPEEAEEKPPSPPPSPLHRVDILA